MENETKNCQNCKQDFTIESEDFNFYEKIKVPAPSWCPECRMVRRFSFGNAWNLFWRNCDLCKKRTLSIYPSYQKILVYCSECWWSDSWDGTEYGMEYDPSRNFFEQIQELTEKTPYVALDTLYPSLKNSNYSNALSWCKDCYMVFWADYCEGVFYSSIMKGSKYSADCIRGYDSELCYGSIGFTKNYRTFFSDECDNCVDVWFSRNCYGCTDCIGCVNMRNASQCIFNVKYSKEDYQKKIKELNLESWSSLQELKKKAYKFWLTKPYREYNGNSLNLNVTGDHVYNSKNSKEMYIANGAENCKYCQLITVEPAKDCMDYSGWGNNADLIYESIGVGENVSNVQFSFICTPDLMNLQYCTWNVAGKNNFGCMNLKRKSYCILNKEYSKEDYDILKEKIIEDMKKIPFIDKLGRKFVYGEFFPLEISKFAYNHSNASKFFPKTKEEALKEGYIWDDTKHAISEFTIKSSSLSDTIKETTDKILEEIIECSNCARAYKIVQGEFDLLRKINLPIPHECSKCRENERFSRMTKPKSYNRNCIKCNTDIYTPYSPKQPNIVYCVKCYQQEVY